MYARSRRAKILPGVSFVRRTCRFTLAQLPPCATLHAMQIAFAMRLIYQKINWVPFQFQNETANLFRKLVRRNFQIAATTLRGTVSPLQTKAYRAGIPEFPTCPIRDFARLRLSRRGAYGTWRPPSTPGVVRPLP